MSGVRSQRSDWNKLTQSQFEQESDTRPPMSEIWIDRNAPKLYLLIRTNVKGAQATAPYYF